MKIGIIITTFLRPKLMYEIVNSILKYWHKDYVLLIGDQSFKTDDEKMIGFADFCDNVKYTIDKLPNWYALPYDCGLSYARNELVNRAKELGCNYIFLSADSYKFTKIYNFNPIINFLESSTERGIIGFVEKNKPDPNWTWDLQLKLGDCFLLSKPKKPNIIYDNLKFQPCDIVQNFFLAKIRTLLDCKWDNDLKLCEHEDFFYRLKYNYPSYLTYFNNSIQCEYINYKPNNYNEKRKRIYNIYKKLLLKKYGIKNWIKVKRD